MKNTPFIIVVVACLSFIQLQGQDKVTDTVMAAVVYGDDMLLDNGVEELSDDELEHYLDSLKSLPVPPKNLIDQVELYRQIPDMSFEEVFSLIDSLFDLEEIPYPLINQINLYVSNMEEDEDEWIDTSNYPAEFYYPSWNTTVPNPYRSASLIAKDSVIQLRLQGGKQLSEFFPPIEGVITSGFGWRDGRNHNGLDIDLEVWDTVRSAFPGMVRVARFYGAYGRVVVVRHWNGLETLYAHLHRIKVKPGDRVEAGELIGLGGSSGRSTGSHLHWEVRFKGVPLNPAHFIDTKTMTLENDTLVLKKTKYGYAAFPSGTIFHEVKRGDFLYKIADQYGTSVTKLCRLNGIRRNQILYVGQKIRVI
jgi:murein DD-endopeptidase MepM/ murein hydrolase activator NlpD